MPYDYLNGARNWIQRHSLKKPFNNNNTNRGPPLHGNRYGGKCYFDMGNFYTDIRNVPVPMPLCKYRPKTVNKSCQTVEEQPPKCICGNYKSMLCRDCLAYNVLGIGHQHSTQEADSESIGSLSSSDFILEPKSQGELLLQSLQRSALEAKITSGAATSRLDPKFVLSARSIVSRNAFELRQPLEEDCATGKSQEKNVTALEDKEEYESSTVVTEAENSPTISGETTEAAFVNTSQMDPTPHCNGQRNVSFAETSENEITTLKPEVEIQPVTNAVTFSDLKERPTEIPLIEYRAMIPKPPNVQPEIDIVINELKQNSRIPNEFQRVIPSPRDKPMKPQFSPKPNAKSQIKRQMKTLSTDDTPITPNLANIPKLAASSIAMNRISAKDNTTRAKKLQNQISTNDRPVLTYPSFMPHYVIAEEIDKNQLSPTRNLNIPKVSEYNPAKQFAPDIPPLEITSDTDIVINELSPKRTSNILRVLEEETFYTTTKFSQYGKAYENVSEAGDAYSGHSTRITHIQQNERYSTITKSLNNLFEKRGCTMECYDDVAVAFNYASKNSRNLSANKTSCSSQENLTETDSNYQSNSGCDEDNEAFEIQIYTVDDGHVFNRSSYL